MTEATPGVEGRITLLGSNGTTRQSHVRIVATHEGHMQLAISGGRVVAVPLSAVKSFEPGSASSFEELADPQASSVLAPDNSEPSDSPKSDQARTQQQPGGESLEAHRSSDSGYESHQITLTEALRRVSETSKVLSGLAQPPNEAEPRSINALFQATRLDLESLKPRVSNVAYSRALDAIIEMLDLSIERTAKDALAEAKSQRDRYEIQRRRARKTLDRFNKRSNIVEVLKICHGAISAAELVDWQRFASRFEAKPRLVIHEGLTSNISGYGEFVIPFRVTLDDGPESARGVKLVIDQRRGIEVVGTAPTIDRLQPGASKTLRLRMRDRRRQGARDDIKIEAHLQYLGPSSEILHSPRQKIGVQLVRPSSFVEIPNPFRDYASGVPVDDPNMFFGRSGIMDDIVHQLTARPVGRCFALYGQKRSGKSSVVNQLQVRLTETGALVARISMGVVDRSAITQTFVGEVVDQLREQVAPLLDSKTFENLLTRWPEASAISSQPLASLRKAITAARALLKSAGHAEPPRVIVMVDEFTYLFELLRRTNVAGSDQNELRDFMRQWKSLLEAKIFSALVVGQDTMPSFIETFPNEFSVMHTERLDYLDQSETQELADMPIRRANGSSRFSGYGLQAVHSYTSGHPYYTQILMDRVVELANDNRRDDITDVDVDSAVATLLSGAREIGMFRFDCLLAADNTDGLLDEMLTNVGINSEDRGADRVLQVVRRIALVSGEQNKPVVIDSLGFSADEARVFNDLRQRHVVHIRDGKVQLRILLFSEYLRRLGS